MVRKITAQKWDDALRDYVPCPLDDADSWTISLASQINGRDLTEQQLKAIFTSNRTRLIRSKC